MLCCIKLPVTVLNNIPQVIHLKHFVLSLEKVGFSLRHLCLSGAFKAARHDYLGLLDSVIPCLHDTFSHIWSLTCQQHHGVIQNSLSVKLPLLHLPSFTSFFKAETLCTHKHSGTCWAKWYWLKWNWLSQCFNKEPVYHQVCPFLPKCVFLKELLNRADNLSHSCLQRAFLILLF